MRIAPTSLAGTDHAADYREIYEELEKEMVQTYDTHEKDREHYDQRISKLEKEKDEWRNKHVALQKTHSSTTATMQVCGQMRKAVMVTDV